MTGAHTLHLARRATFGPTPALLEQIEKAGANAWIDRQLKPSSISDVRCDGVVKRFPGLTWSIPRARREIDEFSWDLMMNVVRATITRAAWSERQLLEVMVDFWSNHLNVTCPSGDVWDNRAHYDTFAIRRHALGSFSDLLVAATLHPAMLRYLDNASSTKWHPNENHGRELLELHTLGVSSGYTEQDVLNSARILTGLTVGADGTAAFRPEWHSTGPVRVLTFTHPNGTASAGRDVAVSYLKWLARHPSTARTIARKLAVRFVSDSPPAALVDRLARTYLRNGTAITPVLRQLLRSQEFAAARDAKVRRPFEDVVGTVRVLGIGPDKAGIKGMQGLGWMLGDLGQAPLGWSPPNGYPDVAAAWQSAAGTLGRWNAHVNIVNGWYPSTLNRPNPTTLLPRTLPRTHGALVDALAKRVLQRSVSPGQRAAICTFLGVTPSAALRADSPAVKWRLPYVVALLLDTPQHQIR